MNNKTIIISRTDSIGDVVLTMPLAGIIKKYYPNSTVLFLGKTYTKPVVELSNFVNGFINFDDIEKHSNPVEYISSFKADIIIHVFPNKILAKLAKQAQIPTRIGTWGRLFHWFSCNKLVIFSRKNSLLHESQLNTKLLAPIGISANFSIPEIINFYGFQKIPTLRPELKQLIDSTKFNLIIHPKSKGSAKEWGIENYNRLIKLAPTNQFKIFISGTEEEGKLIENQLEITSNCVSLIGKMNLMDFIAFINAADGLVAASTGPLHIAAALSKTAIGLYSPKIPIHPGRWKPIGNKAHALVFDKNCESCKKSSACNCISKIDPQHVLDILLKNKN